jgi:DNA-binding transcriptional MerR regulator
MPLVRAFTVEKVLRLTGLSRRQLQYWDERGFLRPSISHQGGRGRPRLYDFRDLVSLRVAAELRADWGISLQQIRKLVQYLRKLDYEHPLGDVEVFARRRKLYFREAGLVREARAPEQSLATFTIPFEPIVHSLEAAIAELDSRHIGQVETRRGTLGSKPVIAGTRIPVATLERMAAAGLGERAIRQRYPDLKTADIRAVLADWRRSQSTLGRRAS